MTKHKNEKNISGRTQVSGAVVLYRPDQDVIENISTYINQVGLLIVIDNSDIVNSQVIDEIKSFDNVNYVSYGKNLGIARALNDAAEIAIENGYQYLLTMDQDSKAPVNLVIAGITIFEGNEQVALVTPIHGNKYGTHTKLVVGKTEKVNMAMTSGNLISLNVYKKVGGFDEDFFLDYMDIEYCFKLNLHNYDLIRLGDLVLEHNEADLTEIKFFNKKVHPHNHKPFRWYYKTRNMFVLRKKYQKLFPELFSIEFNAYLRMIARLILFEKHKIQKIRMILLGYLDYLKRKKGRKF